MRRRQSRRCRSALVDYLTAPAALTQREMDAAYAVPPDFYLVFRLQLVSKFVVLCCIYAAALPVLYLLVAGLLAIAPLIDRWNLLRRYVKTKDTDESLVCTVLIFVLPLAVLAHLLMAYALFSGLLTEAADAAYTFFPPTQGTHTEQGEIWAMRFVLLSLILNGGYLLFFIYREWSHHLLGVAGGQKIMQRIESGTSALARVGAIMGFTKASGAGASFERLHDHSGGVGMGHLEAADLPEYAAPALSLGAHRR